MSNDPIRDELEKRLGIEMYTPEELEEKLQEAPVKTRAEVEAEAPPSMRKTSVSDIINQCNEAASKMGANNDHRILLFNCAFALKQLVERLYALERPTGVH